MPVVDLGRLTERALTTALRLGGTVAPVSVATTALRTTMKNGHHVSVLFAEVEPRRRRYQILHDQRGLVLTAALRSRTDAIVATLPFRLASQLTPTAIVFINASVSSAQFSVPTAPARPELRSRSSSSFSPWTRTAPSAVTSPRPRTPPPTERR